MRRTKIDIIYDIFRAINDKGGTILPTHLLYKSNLSHKRMKSYLNDLKEKNLIQDVETKGKTKIKMTEEGLKFFANYRQLKAFTDAFGL